MQITSGPFVWLTSRARFRSAFRGSMCLAAQDRRDLARQAGVQIFDGPRHGTRRVHLPMNGHALSRVLISVTVLCRIFIYVSTAPCQKK